MTRSSSKIVIVDYKMGNLTSVANALRFLGHDAVISDQKETLLAADAVILPGVGAFGIAMQNLKKLDLIAPLNEKVRGQKVPFLGICLGMQLIADSSDEMGHNAGLGWIPGQVKRLQGDSSLRVPHVGWNNTEIKKTAPLFEGIAGAPDYYYVHSYYYECDEKYVAARCNYGTSFVSAVQSENMYAVQFHPEKSQHNGLKLLRNFTRTLPQKAE